VKLFTSGEVVSPGGKKRMSDNNESSGSFAYRMYEDDDYDYGDFNAESMANMAALINELSDEGRITPLTQASTTIQDHMDAWVMWKQYIDEVGESGKYRYADFLFNIVAKRAIHISLDIQ